MSVSESATRKAKGRATSRRPARTAKVSDDSVNSESPPESKISAGEAVGPLLPETSLPGDTSIDVELYAPRPHQGVLHKSLKRFNVLVAHRRFGKTVFCINELIAKAAANNLPEPRYAYIAPLLTQAKDIAWGYLKKYAMPIPGVGVTETELRVDLPGGARIRLYGADNADRLRGLYFDGVVLDEYAQMSPRVWAEVVRPALTDRHGWALFIGTPMGRNQFAQLYDHARRDPDWHAVRFRASETGIIPLAELEAARKSMSEEQFAQEFECSFDVAIPGAYYARLIEAAEQAGRICNLPWEPRLPVHTAWDLGIGDATAIWFWQQSGAELRVIDYYEASGAGLAHYAKHLAALPYVYGEHFLPHDAEVRELGTGNSRVETLRSLGVRPRILKADKVEDGIEAVRNLLPKCWFDAEKCARGLEALRQYRNDFNERLQAPRPRPLHDWTSHAADAFRYLAMSRRPTPRARPPLRPEEARAYHPFDW